MTKASTLWGGILIALLFTATAYAADEKTADKAPKLRKAESCFPAKGLVKHLRKFSGLKAEKRDTVGMIPTAKFEILDGGAMPERFYSKDEAAEFDFTIDSDGTVTDFAKIEEVSEGAELCIFDPSRAGTPADGRAAKFDIDMDVQFLENTGYHDMATLKDGLKDGKSFYKKMMPGPMRLMVPKLTHVMVTYDNEDTPAQFSAMNGQVPLAGLASEEYCEQTIINVEDIEDMGGDGLQVTGGAYMLLPVPNAKTLAKFAKCKDEENEEE